MRGFLLIVAVLAMLSAIVCQSLSKIPIVGDFSVVKVVSEYAFVIYPVSVFLLAFVFSGNLVVSFLAAFVVGLLLNWGVIFG